MPLGIIDTKDDGPLAGTELLVSGATTDSSVNHDTSHLKRVVYRGAETVLVPQPSNNDPNDPLLWPRWKKEVSFAVVLLNNIVFAAVPGPIIAPSTFALAGIFKVPITSIAELSGYNLLLVGAIGPLVSVLAQKYGKRPQFLFAVITGTLGTIVCIIGAEQTNYNTLLAGRMVQGLGTTAWESLSLAAVGDMFFLHERGIRTAIMVASLTCLPSMTSIIAGVLTENTGWRNIFIALLPFNVVGLLATVFFLPESQFRRDTVSARGNTRENAATRRGENEKSQELPTTHHAPTQGSDEDVASQPLEAPKHSYARELRPWSGKYTEKNIFHLLSEIFVHLLNPAVIWILLVSGVLISLFVVSAYITSQIFSVPPYLLNVAQNGYFYTGSFVGGVLSIVAGPICDWSARVLARMNRGVFEAEFRIPVNILGAVCSALGWFLFMWDVDNPRSNGYYLGSFCYGLACFGISVPSTSAGLYILDSFPNQSTEVFILQMMLKNFLFYAFSTFINTWAAESGAGTIFRTWGIVSLCLIATCIPMYVFGKLNRKFMRDMYANHKIFRAVA